MIVNEDQLRAMEFIVAVNNGGYRPTGGEINEWRLRPEPKPARQGKLLQPEIPGTRDQRVRVGGTPALDNLLISSALRDRGTVGDAVARQLAGLGSFQLGGLQTSIGQAIAAMAGSGTLNFPGFQYKTVPGTPGKAAVYAPDKRPEGFLAHLRRLGWVERDSRRRYGITLLGQALLNAQAIEEFDAANSSVVVLAAEDQNLGYGRVIGRIADSGDVLIADHYLGTEELMHILEQTDATRFLIGPKHNRGRVSELAILIKLAPPNSNGTVRELRRAEFHDRYLVGEHKVYTLTASLNGVSKSSMALLVEMTDVAARAVRSHANELWDSGEVVATGLALGELAGAESDEPGADEREVSEVDGKFFHDGCDIKHRSDQAARNCTKGT